MQDVYRRLPMRQGIVGTAAVLRRHARQPDGAQRHWLPELAGPVHRLPERHELLSRLGGASSMPARLVLGY